MLAKLIISSDIKKRSEAIETIIKQNNLYKDHPDVLFFKDKEKLGVDQTKKMKEFLSLKPYSAEGRMLILVSAQDLTVPAQNSILKILEEPPETSNILLGVNSDNSLLSTIISRCEVMYLDKGSDSINESDEQIKNLLKLSTTERFKFIESVEDKERFLKELITFFRSNSKKKSSNIEFLKELLKAEEWIKSNVNPRGVLEYLMLSMPIIK